MKNKRTKKIKSAKDLPNWFSLDAYTPAANFTASDWLHAISVRLLRCSDNGAHGWLADIAHGERWAVGRNHPEFNEIAFEFDSIYCETNGVVTAFGAAIPETNAGYSDEDTARFDRIRDAELKRERELLDSLTHKEFHLLSGGTSSFVDAPAAV